jgi:RNA polymerase sigma-70 factor, ECF subfamily
MSHTRLLSHPLAAAALARPWSTVDAVEATTGGGDDTRADHDGRRPTRYHREAGADGGQLLRRAQAGDRQAFAELYHRYVNDVRRYVAVRMRDTDRDAVPDLVQDTFCQALAELPSARADIRIWLIGLAAKACTRFDWSRRRYLRAAYAVYATDRASAGYDQGYPEQAPTIPGRLPIVHALARLAPDQRRAIQLRYLEGCPRDLAARLMGRTPNAVKLLERRALKRLRDSFGAAAADRATTHGPTLTGARQAGSRP